MSLAYPFGFLQRSILFTCLFIYPPNFQSGVCFFNRSIEVKFPKVSAITDLVNAAENSVPAATKSKKWDSVIFAHDKKALSQ